MYMYNKTSFSTGTNLWRRSKTVELCPIERLDFVLFCHITWISRVASTSKSCIPFTTFCKGSSERCAPRLSTEAAENDMWLFIYYDGVQGK